MTSPPALLLPLRGGQIGRPNLVVQVDEAQVGRRKYHRGRVFSDTWVLGMIDEVGELRLEICTRREAATLLRLMQRHVAAGSEVHTDWWLAYKGPGALGYHRVVNHRVEFVAADGTHTQRIESQ